MALKDVFKFLKKDEFDKIEKKQLFGESAVTRAFYYLNYLPDPEIVLKQMGGRRRLIDLLQDDEIYAAVETRRVAAISTPWQLVGGDEDENALLYNIIKPHVERVLSDAWEAVLYGYSVIEPVYFFDSEIKAIAIQKAIGKPFWWFKFNQDHELVYMGEHSLQGEITQKGKFVVSVNQSSYLNPYGTPLLSKVFYPYKMRCCGWQFWVDALEKFAVPFLHGKTEDLALADGTSTIQAFAKMLDKANRGSSIVTSKEAEVSLLNPSMTSSHFPEFDKAVNQRIQKAILGQTLTTQVDGQGSFAAAKVHSDVKDDRRRNDIKIISNALQQIVDTLYFLNEMSGGIPEVVMKDDDTLNTTQADRDIKLYQVGVEFTPKYIQENYNLDDEDFKVVPKQTSGFGFPQGDVQASSNHCPVHSFAKDKGKTKLTEKQQVLEDLGDSLIKKDKFVLSAEDILAVVRASSDEKDLKDRLSVLLDADSTEFEEELTRGLYAASVMGYVNN